MPKLSHVIAALGALALVATASTDAFAGPPGQAKHKAKHKRHGDGETWKPRKGRHKAKHRGGPPPWAPAHGYRRKYVTYQTHDHRQVRIPESRLVLRTASGIAQCNRDVVGAVFGGAAGAAVGSRFGKGSGKTATTIAGAIIGSIIGGNIGRAMDQVDQNCVGQALERAATGGTVVWHNPDNGGNYKVTPTETYQSAGGQFCREYTTTVVIDGRNEQAYGRACREPDGSWRREG